MPPRLASAGQGLASTSLNLKLADPAQRAGVRRQAQPAPGRRRRARAASDPPPPFLQPWQDIREASANLVKNQRRALMTGAWLLALLAVASVAVLVGGRMADQIRRVGLLKAVGGTPGLVAAVLLAEYVVVALARGGGRARARMADRSMVHRSASAGLLGSAGAHATALSTIAHRDGRRARGRGRGHPDPRRPRGPDQHGPRTRRRGPPAAAQRPG